MNHSFLTRLNRINLARAIFLFLAIVVYHRALSFGFLADDAWAFYMASLPGSWLTPNPESPHYPPLHFPLYYGLFQIFHFHAPPYHGLQLLLVAGNAALVKALAGRLGLPPWQGWVAGLFVLLNSVAAEAYLWFCIINTVLMTGLVVGALLCLVQWRQGGAWGWAAGYLAATILALGMDGKALILPWLGLILDWGWDRPSGPLAARSTLKKYLPHLLAFAAAGGLILLRVLLAVKSATIHLPLGEKWRTLRTTLLATFYRGLEDHLWGLWHNPGIWHTITRYLWVALVVLLILGFWWSRGQERRRFLTLALLWVASCLPHTLGANLQFRYFYLPGVFAALLLVVLLGILARRLCGPGRAYLLIGLLVGGFLYMDLKGLHLAQNSFQEASHLYDAGIAHIRRSLPTLPPGANLVLLDFPFYLYNQQSQGGPRPGHIPYVYVFPQALPYHLQLLYQVDDLHIDFVSTNPGSQQDFVPMGKPADPAALSRLLSRPQTWAFRYLPGKTPPYIFMR